MFAWRGSGGSTTLGFTDRHGGVSGGDFASLNLAHHVGDNGEDVRVNRARLADSLGVDVARLVFMDQVHGAEVVTVERPSPPRPSPPADAIVSACAEVVLVVQVADCVPVLLHDDEAGVVAAAHAGRAGLAAGIVPAAVSAMRRLGASQISAVIGPSICPGCYEVPAELRASVCQSVPSSWATSVDGTPALDLAVGVQTQLLQLGVAVRRIPGCTRESLDLYSHRRDAPTGRFAGFIGRSLPVTDWPA